MLYSDIKKIPLYYGEQPKVLLESVLVGKKPVKSKVYLDIYRDIT